MGHRVGQTEVQRLLVDKGNAERTGGELILAFTASIVVYNLELLIWTSNLWWLGSTANHIGPV